MHPISRQTPLHLEKKLVNSVSNLLLNIQREGDAKGLVSFSFLFSCRRKFEILFCSARSYERYVLSHAAGKDLWRTSRDEFKALLLSFTSFFLITVKVNKLCYIVTIPVLTGFVKLIFLPMSD